ncbi:hypothetical protein [Prochlorococcus marinus]|uniref:hypothetical protein n=1 Tax=Prochlorococcus marinus TaxID=1219 RepID=UPI0022B3EF40|nr:hypothetical protein [Prochlorococcus marinus]
MNRHNSAHQRKTTLKWTSDGELSPIDKARILEKLTNKDLTECKLACKVVSQKQSDLDLGLWW